MNILHVSIADQARGATRAAFWLHTAQIKLGHSSRMLVGQKRDKRPEIDMLPVRKTLRQKALYRIVNRLEECTGLQYLLQPWKSQFLRHPFTQQSDVINLHNIHSGYFSHTILPRLSRKAPLVWTLHDMWSMTGHCSFPTLYGCERWKTGCGHCPALSDYPPISIDTTALLWRIKNRVFRQSDLTIVTPSHWMAKMVRESPLLNRFEMHHIPYGLDTKVFKPTPKLVARSTLGLPAHAHIVLFAAFDVFHPRKGGVYLFEALDRVISQGKKDLLLLIVGSQQVPSSERYRFATRSLGLITDDDLLAVCYSAADLYVGPSLAEAFALVFIESMACGTPVVAFDGTPASEAVHHLETGYLARYKDVDDLAHALCLLLDDTALRERLGKRAREVVEREYTVELEAIRYLELYERLLGRQHRQEDDHSI